MEYTEELLWILDRVVDGAVEMTDLSKEAINIEFVHSLGQKCDFVGWSRLDLSAPEADDILDKIAVFCKENSFATRGVYKRNCIHADSDWFELIYKDCNYDNWSWDRVPAEGGGECCLPTVKAYREQPSEPQLVRGAALCVPERFRDACLRLGIDGLDFCWVKDTGKYAAGQYFAIYPRNAPGHILTDRGLDFFFKELTPAVADRLKVLGGYLPRLTTDFRHLMVELPDMYFASELPPYGIVVFFCPSEAGFVGRYKLLIHRHTAELLLAEKAILPKQLRPAPVVDSIPEGYRLSNCSPLTRPTQEHMARQLKAYEALKASPRPQRQVSEKQALSRLRRAKRDRKEDFQKALPKVQAAALEGNYAALAPYYLVVNGGQLSDEYLLLSYEQSIDRSRKIKAAMDADELLEQKITGTAIASCSDGDTVLLSEDGKVLRLSHEDPVVYTSWPNLPQFIFDALSEDDA